MQDLRKIVWGKSRLGQSYGCFMKTTVVKGTKKYYYKLSNYDSEHGFYGDEVLTEVIVSRLLKYLGFNCVKYKCLDALVRVYNIEYRTLVCVSEDYTRGYDSRIAFELLRESNMDVPIMQLLSQYGLLPAVRDMLLADFLVINRDRHGANIELLLKNGKYSLAPLFDNGMSLLAPYPQSFGFDISKFGVMQDYPVNNYIGYKSLYKNLEVNNGFSRCVNPLGSLSKNKLFGGLYNYMNKSYRDKIWEIIQCRYNYLLNRGCIYERKGI